MAWICLRALEDYHAPYQSGLGRLPIVRVIASVRELSSPEYQICHSQTPEFGTMLELSGEATSLLTQSISSTAASRARILAVQEMERAWKETVVAFFLRWSGWSVKLIPDSSSSKMSQLSAYVAGNALGRNWPQEGMIVDGELFPLEKLAPLTLGKDGFCSPTPTATDAKSSRNLTVRNRKVKGHSGMTLTDFVTLFPTPTAARYGTSNNGNPGDGRKQYRLKGKLSLESMARQNLWPTSTARDHRSACPDKRELPNGRPLPEAVGGLLNPTWVEWLMGYQSGWTALEPWAMQWFLSKREKRSKD